MKGLSGVPQDVEIMDLEQWVIDLYIGLRQRAIVRAAKQPNRNNEFIESVLEVVYIILDIGVWDF